MGEPLPVPPFEVVSVHDGHKLTVIDIDEDPLDVGVRCAYFREGGWLMISDLLKNFTISTAERVSRLPAFPRLVRHRQMRRKRQT